MPLVNKANLLVNKANLLGNKSFDLKMALVHKSRSNDLIHKWICLIHKRICLIHKSDLPYSQVPVKNVNIYR